MRPPDTIRRDTGVRVHAVAADVSGAAEAASLVETTVAQYGGLDIVVHNAGGPPGGRVPRDDRGAVAEGVRAEPHELRAARQRGGAGDEARRRRPHPHHRVVVDQAADSESRAVERAARGHLGPGEDAGARARARPGILVNVIAPGRIQTERIEELDQANATEGREADRGDQDRRRSRRFRSAGSAVRRSSPTWSRSSRRTAASYITGQAIFVDGAAGTAL